MQGKEQKIIDDMVNGADEYKMQVYKQAGKDLVKAEEVLVYATTLIKVGKLMIDIANELHENHPMIARMVLTNSKQLSTTVEYMNKEHKKIMERVDDAL
jgi:D-ribose pyranose/furanose isomerase RbsD